jgi:uncharacterized protein (TIGR03435 family)
MKKLVLRIIALSVLSGGALLAQDITGTWQGTLQAPKQELRTVIKIAKADGGGLKATMYSIDQGGQGFAGTVTLQGSTVKISAPAIQGFYEGKLDGDALTGTWTQGLVAAPLPLTLSHATSDRAWEIPEPAVRPSAMPADADPVFEVATIKPNTSGVLAKKVGISGRQISTTNTSVSYLITYAYGIQAKQITGGPAWLESEKYDVTGKPEGEGQPSPNQWKAMIQKLLADRFQLTFHRDKKELSVYVIVVARNGPKLTRSEGNLNGGPSLLFKGASLPGKNATVGDLAGVMERTVLDRPVVDQTGLAGRFDFNLIWTPDETQFGGARVRPPAGLATAPPDLFAAMQEQLGLKLQASKAPVDVIVIDKVSKPSEN